MEGATDGTEVRGRPSAENDGSVARTEGGGSMSRPALCKLGATAIITHQIYKPPIAQLGVLTQPAFRSIPLHDLWACLPNQHSTPGMLAGSVGMLTPPAFQHMACLPGLWACLPHQPSNTWHACLICGCQPSTTWHACLICGHAYPASAPLHGMLAKSVGMLTPPALHHMACLPDLWACLPHQHSTTWHACRMCGHAYPTSIPPHGMLARSVGMLTPPALHHMACLPDVWACLPHQHSTTWHACRMCGHTYPTSIPPHGMLARSVGMFTPPALHHMACLPDVWACLPHQHSTTWHACRICGHAYPSYPQA